MGDRGGQDGECGNMGTDGGTWETEGDKGADVGDMRDKGRHVRGTCGWDSRTWGQGRE